MSESTLSDDERTIETRLAGFVEATKATEQYERFVASQRQLADDEEAQRLLEEFQRKQRELQQDGFDPETMAELRDLQGKLDDNGTIRELREAQTALIDLLEETNELVSERIGEEFARTTGGGCC